ncbi:Cytochrome P450 4g15, partial [Camponotus floridanus]
ILHRRHYDFRLRSDITFKFSKFAKKQEKLLNIIHILTNNVIEEKSRSIDDIKEEQKNDQKKKPMENEIKNNENDKNITYTKLHYVRDDLDDIDENDIGEKRRLAFLEMMIDLKKNGEKMTDKEIWEEVNTIMFE